MFDSIAEDFSGISFAELSRAACDGLRGIGADGILVLVKDGQGRYGMRMFNPDGSEAEMCGNGIRCIARLAQTYLSKKEFVLTSGGKLYPTILSEDIYPGIPTYGVDIAVSLRSEDFGMQMAQTGFIDSVIEELDPQLRFTAINVGNPHVIAKVDKIDYALLESLGRRVLALERVFPHGVNVSLVEKRKEDEIFVATYERGAGITPSCGTAMTSSATAMALLGECPYEKPIRVINRGGMVRTICHRQPLKTTLIGNATYVNKGIVTITQNGYSFSVLEHCTSEEQLYGRFLDGLK